MRLIRVAMAAFAAALFLPLSMATASYQAFSCDTPEVAIPGSRVVSAVPMPAIRSSKCPNGAGPGDNYGPSAPAPACRPPFQFTCQPGSQDTSVSATCSNVAGRVVCCYFLKRTTFNIKNLLHVNVTTQALPRLGRASARPRRSRLRSMRCR